MTLGPAILLIVTGGMWVLLMLFSIAALLINSGEE